MRFLIVSQGHEKTVEKIEPLKFHDMKQPVLFITSVYDLENLIKKSLILSTGLLDKIINANINNKKTLIFYRHAIRYILDDISALSVFIEKLSREDLINTIPKTLDCLSELYACCIVIKENYEENYEEIHKILDNIIALIHPYIKVTEEKINYEEIHKKIALKQIQNVITNEIGKCENLKKLNDINYIVTMLLREDLREVEDIAEIIRKRRLISKD